ncbi:MAG: hypothetical protein JST85_22485 [Acidobacteria bacterium]|nr:hypothetical protein [Acidobacteriota bacterium]
MSIKTSRSRVQSVSSTSASTTIGGALLAAAVLGVLVRSLSQEAKAVYEQVTNSLPQKANGIKSLTALRAEQKDYQQQASLNAAAMLSPVEAAKVSTLASLSAAPYMVSNQAVLEQPLNELRSAASLAAVQRAGQAIRQQLEIGHHQVMLQSLTLACSNAALKSGFGSIQTLTGPAGSVRIIASDPAGRALVTEISGDPSRDISLETEVVGVSDGSCTALLDAFDAALESEGVRTSTPQRKYTGGVCELAAARDFVRSKVRCQPPAMQLPSAEAKNDSEARRAQRLNSQQKQKQR